MILATKENHIEIGQLLLKAGADIDIVDFHRRSALIHTADRGFYEMARLLIESGANLDK